MYFKQHSHCEFLTLILCPVVRAIKKMCSFFFTCWVLIRIPGEHLLFLLKWRYFYQIELDFGYKICAVLCNIYVRDKEEANGQNMSGKWIYNFKVNVDWCSFAKVVLHKNSKGLSLTRTHGQSVELGNCEFFIMAGRGYLHFTVHSNLAHLYSAPKL